MLYQHIVKTITLSITLLHMLSILKFNGIHVIVLLNSDCDAVGLVMHLMENLQSVACRGLEV